MSDQLIEQLKKLKEVKPSQKTREEIWGFLASEIRKDKEERYEEIAMQDNWAKRLVYQTRFVKLAWKPVAVFALIAMFILGSSGWAVVAAQDSMAGETLFIVKKAFEKTQSLVAADTAHRVELSGAFFGNRVNELQKALEKESQLVSAQGNKQSTAVASAVEEVKKQLADVDNEFSKLQAEDDQNSQKTAAAALALNEKIITYQRDLQEVKDQVEDKAVSEELDKALEQVDDINSNVLEVIVVQHEKGELALPEGELAVRLEQHVSQIEEKLEEAVAQADEELIEKANVAKQTITKAKDAIARGEYKLGLTLSSDSNEILKMLYGEVDEVEVVDSEDYTDDTLINPDNSDNVNVEDDQVKGAETVEQVDLETESDESAYVPTYVGTSAGKEVEEDEEFEVKIQ